MRLLETCLFVSGCSIVVAAISIFRYGQDLTGCPAVTSQIEIKPGFEWHDTDKNSTIDVSIPRHELQLCYHKATFVSNLDYDITLVSFTTADRILNLVKIATLWSGSISLAYYVKSHEADLAILEETLRNNPAIRRFTTIHLIWAVGTELFPINLLRNVASIAVSTSHTIHYDIDFSPSKNMRQALLKRRSYLQASVTGTSKELLVIPAFEVSPLLNKTLVEEEAFTTASLTQVKKKVADGTLLPFHWHCKHCQRPTNHIKWSNASLTQPYEVEGEPPIAYEPYVVSPTYIMDAASGKRSLFLLWDEVFIGYGRDKTIFYFHLRAYFGYKFIVLPDVAILHRAHPKSDVAVEWGRSEQSIMDRVTLYERRVAWWLSTVSNDSSSTMDLFNFHGTGRSLPSTYVEESIKDGVAVPKGDSVTSGQTCQEKYAGATFFANDEQALQGRYLISSWLENANKYNVVVLLSSQVSETIATQLCEIDGLQVMRISNYELNTVLTSEPDSALFVALTLTQYEKVFYLDYSKIVQRPLGQLFHIDFDGIGASPDDSGQPRSGAYLVKTSKEASDSLWTAYSPDVPVSTLLGNFFTAWTRLGDTYNSKEIRSVAHVISSNTSSNIRNILRALRFIGSDTSEPNRWTKIVAFNSLKRFSPPAHHRYFHCFETLKKEPLCNKITSHACLDESSCSNKVETPDAITLSTQISLNRFHRLEAITQSWTGPVSVAIWVHKSEREQMFMTLLEHDLPYSRISIHLSEQKSRDPFPINGLRNLAIKYSVTDMVLVLDVDFTMMPLSHEILTDADHQYIAEDTKQKHIMIIPTFDYSPRIQCPMEEPDPCVHFPRNKTFLAIRHEQRLLEQFHSTIFFPGQGPTDYDRWFKAEQPYYVAWKPFYEPYIILRKSSADFTWFNEGFVNRGYNKAVLAFELYVRGFHFTVVPDVFAIHVFESLTQRNSAGTYKPFLRKVGLHSSKVERELREKFNCPVNQTGCVDFALTYKERYGPL